MGRRPGGRWKLAVLAGCGVVLPLMILEILFRIAAPDLRGSHQHPSAPLRDDFLTEDRLGRHDAELGWTLRPAATTVNRSWEFEHPIRTNSRGYRDDDTPYERAPGTRRILLLGDSFAMGDGVERGELFADVLETLLPRTEVVNLGVSGYGTDQELLTYLREGRKYRPDVVLLALTIDNDFANNAMARQYGLNKPYFTAENGQLQLQGVPVPTNARAGSPGAPARNTGRDAGSTSIRALHNVLDARSALYAAMLDRLATVVPARAWLERRGLLLPQVEVFSMAQIGILSSPPSPGLERAWQVTLRLLDAWRQQALADGAKPVLALIPSHLQVDQGNWSQVVRDYNLAAGDFDPDYPDRRLLSFCASRELTCVDLLTGFREADRAGRSLYYRRNPHWNAAGHRLAAELIAAALGPPPSSRPGM